MRDLHDRPLAVEGSRATDIAAMVRHAIGSAGCRAGLASEVISELMGHGGSQRIRVQPLPNVGYRHADGRIRRVMLTVPGNIDEDHWTDVLSRLIGAELIPPDQDEPIGTLTPIVGNDPILARYCGDARTWTTATPVVLPGHDHRRGRPRPDRLVERLLRHAGIPEKMVERMTIEPGGRLRGSEIARSVQAATTPDKVSVSAHVHSMEGVRHWADQSRRGCRIWARSLPAH